MAAFFSYLSLIILCIILISMKDLRDIKDIYIFNISTDIFGMIMGFVLFICTLIDVQKIGASNRSFLYLLNVIFLGLFTDACAWLVDAIPSLRILNLLDNTLYYLCNPFAAFFFWRYSAGFFRLDRKLAGFLDRIARIGLFVAVGTCIFNLFFGYYFTINPAGTYERRWLYPVSMIYSSFVLIAVVIILIQQRRFINRNHWVSLVLYIIAPIILSILTMTVYGLSIAYPMLMINLLLMYCLINVDQGRNKMVSDRDLAIATAIQAGFLPSEFPAFPDRTDFDIHASMQAAKEVGGDFYDFYLIDDRHLVITMADVSGKGVPASLFMAVSKTMLKDHMMLIQSPAKSMTDINERLCNNNPGDLFVTLWLGLLDCETGHLTYINAGHNPPILQRAGGETVYLEEQGDGQFMLAGMPYFEYEESELTLEPGDSIFLYTDGVTEAKNVDDEFFGEDRLIKLIDGLREYTPREIVETVNREISIFRGKAVQFDDITMLHLRYKEHFSERS
ncbi:MAG: SpoIIE family protein phosphatase [Lachnospiraceae bacterium]|nr:SpoIIE family protein phosphatase [Lachnospiraceae bacterium]